MGTRSLREGVPDCLPSPDSGSTFCAAQHGQLSPKGRFRALLTRLPYSGDQLLTASAQCRLSTAGLLAVLGILNRQWYFCFLALLMLDIFSHWFQMYATLAAGAATHKVACFGSGDMHLLYQCCRTGHCAESSAQHSQQVPDHGKPASGVSCNADETGTCCVL